MSLFDRPSLVTRAKHIRTLEWRLRVRNVSIRLEETIERMIQILSRTLIGLTLCFTIIGCQQADEVTETGSESLDVIDGTAVWDHQDVALTIIDQWDQTEVTFGSPEVQFATAGGREDLALPIQSSIPFPPKCGSTGGDPIDKIVELAQETSIVFINEAHDAPRHRQFALDVSLRLNEVGYAIFAAETFDETIGQGRRYPTMSDGYYSVEPIYGRLIRNLQNRGFGLAAYHPSNYEGYEKVSFGTTDEERANALAIQEEQTARSLIDRVINRWPNQKIIVHVGYSHAMDEPIGDISVSWLAALVKEETGVDPLTVSLTSCNGSGNGFEEAWAGDLSESDNGFAGVDIAVASPVIEFSDGRPDWRQRRGDKVVQIPDALRSASRTVVVEARLNGEPIDAVPVDRIVNRPGENLPLLLPEGDYWILAWTLEGQYGPTVVTQVR